MFKLNVMHKEIDGFIYKIMNIDLGNKVEEIYIKIPISEKEYITDSYDPYVFFNLFKMMSIGGDCYINGKVNKSLLDNLEYFVECWRIWLPDKCKKINIIAGKEIDDVPKKLNNNAVLAYSGGIDSTATLYRHTNGLAGRNTKNITKLINVYGGRGIRGRAMTLIEKDAHYKELVLKNKTKVKGIAEELGYKEIIPIITNLYETESVFFWGDEFISLYVSMLMLYQDTCNNLLLASDEFIHPKCITLPHGSNPISNKYIASNQFKLITDGEFLTRIDKINILKNFTTAIKNFDCCDNIYQTTKNCGICGSCIVTKFDILLSDIDYELGLLFDNTEISDIKSINNLTKTKIDLLNEILYHVKYNDNISDKNKDIIDYITYIVDNYYNKDKIILNGLNNKLKIHNDRINKIAWWIPIRKWRDNFRSKFALEDQTRPDQTRPDQTRPNM
ncbi:hypothetical protein [Brachyspira pulli]|uniref:hypothetical protein n=1 Tax=Brachyspira pulli TaxID=310721 RepID=UPI0030065FC9